jgi:hypothetical protein
VSTCSTVLPDLDVIVKVNVPTLHHVPKGCRDAWAKALSRVVASISASPTDLNKWGLLFMLTKCVLVSPARSIRQSWQATSKLVKERLKRWSNNDFLGLWSTVLSEAEKHKRSRRMSDIHSNNIRRARLAAEQGQFHKAIQALTSLGVAQSSSNVTEEMLRKLSHYLLSTL